MVTNFDFHLNSGIHDYIHARAKLDKSYSLAASYCISYFFGEDNSTRQQAGNLFENHRLTIPLDGNDVLLVDLAGGGIHSVAEFPLAIFNSADHTRNRRAIHVNVKDVEKHADPLHA